MSAGGESEKKEDIKIVIARKLLGQEANTLILIACLCGFGYVFWWAITTGVPTYLKQINEGYKSVSIEHRETVNEIVTDNNRRQDSLQAVFEKTLDRIERKFEEKGGKQQVVTNQKEEDCE